MSVDRLLAWAKSPNTHRAVETGRDELFSLIVAEVSKRPLAEIVRDYDDAMDVLDGVGADQDAWEAANLHLAAVKSAHDMQKSAG